MTALTDNKLAPEKEGKLVEMPVKSGEAIFRNALVMVDPISVGILPAAALLNARFAGIAYEDNKDGAAVVRVQRSGSIILVGSGFVAGDLLKPVYASDDQTVSVTQGTNELEVGVILEVLSATEVMVDLKRY